MSDDQEIKTLVQELSNKINNAKVLNGGFDKLVDKVDSMQTDLQELKFEYKAESMLVKERQDSTKSEIMSIKSDVSEIKQQISNPVTGLIVRVNHTDDHVSRIEGITGGKDLIELQDSIRTFKAFKKYFWALILTSVGTAAKLIFDLVK